MKRVILSGLSRLATIVILISATPQSPLFAQTLSNFWTYQTSKTGATKFDTRQLAEAAIQAGSAADSYLQYSGQDDGG